jgi:hypothetical protein
MLTIFSPFSPLLRRLARSGSRPACRCLLLPPLHSSQYMPFAPTPILISCPNSAPPSHFRPLHQDPRRFYRQRAAWCLRIRRKDAKLTPRAYVIRNGVDLVVLGGRQPSLEPIVPELPPQWPCPNLRVSMPEKMYSVDFLVEMGYVWIRPWMWTITSKPLGTSTHVGTFLHFFYTFRNEQVCNWT